jgi:hypothetical protein
MAEDPGRVAGGDAGEGQVEASHVRDALEVLLAGGMLPDRPQGVRIIVHRDPRCESERDSPEQIVRLHVERAGEDGEFIAADMAKAGSESIDVALIALR